MSLDAGFVAYGKVHRMDNPSIGSIGHPDMVPEFCRQRVKNGPWQL
jgi:hypothetical protein